MKTSLLMAVLALLLCAAAPQPGYSQAAESVESLMLKVDALEEINKQLRQQVKDLKRALASSGTDTAAFNQQALAVPPADAESDTTDLTAIEQALTSRGIAVLAPWQAVVEPGVGWAHSGAGAGANDFFAAYLSARMGLPYDAMISVGLPYAIDTGDRRGNDSGFGDPSVRLSKQILGPSDTLPTVVANVSYVSNIGNRKLSGYSSLRGGVSVSKNVDPVVFYGNFDVDYPFEEDNVRPGIGYYVGGGASLAVTPTISTSLGLTVGFLDNWSSGSRDIDNSAQTVGYLRHNWDFAINRHVDISLTGTVGLTDDSEDFGFAVGMPIKF